MTICRYLYKQTKNERSRKLAKQDARQRNIPECKCFFCDLDGRSFLENDFSGRVQLALVPWPARMPTPRHHNNRVTGEPWCRCRQLLNTDDVAVLELGFARGPEGLYFVLLVVRERHAWVRNIEKGADKGNFK